MSQSIEVILNARSGSQRADESREVLERVLGNSGSGYGISIAAGNEIARLAEKKAATGCEVLVAGGGDGTVCCVAEAALKHGKTIGVLPLGTFNYFARNLGVPLSLEEAAHVILSGRKTRTAVLELNGRLVLNNSSIGIHPAVLLRRRRIYRRWGRSQFNAYVSVCLTALQPPPRLRVRLASEEQTTELRTPLVMVCSNAFQMESFNLAGQECLESGKFALYVGRMVGRWTIFRGGMRILLGRLRPGVDYEVICTSDVTIETTRRRHFWVAVDGELEKLEMPLRFRFRPGALSVIVPQAAAGQ